VRSLQTALQRRAELDREYSLAIGSSGGLALEALQGQIARQDTLIQTNFQVLRKEFPAFFQFVSQAPLDLPTLQGGGDPLIRANEALLLITTDADKASGYVWVITADEVAWAQLPQSDYEARIAYLRSVLDPVGTRSPDSGQGSDDLHGGRSFDRDKAQSLFSDLFGNPDISAVAGKKSHWLIIPQGAFVALPFSTLVTSPPPSGETPDSFRNTKWLALEHVLSVLPSVSSIKGVRQQELVRTTADRNFFGLGDPDFQGAIDAPVRSVDEYYQGEMSAVAALRQLPKLPGTREEIIGLAKSYSEGMSDYLLGSDATEYNLTHRRTGQELSHYRILAFATHGLVAGNLNNQLIEPALAMTPPQTPTATDDGLLTASEAALLKLDADWVILSACNTAAGGDKNAEAFTGLARGFLLGGARALLVSHWRVRDDVAPRITTRTIQLMEGQGDVSRAYALQSAMRELMMDNTLDGAGKTFAQPSAWAAFTLVGAD
jgi:CHAT domain-containing protein